MFLEAFSKLEFVDRNLRTELATRQKRILRMIISHITICSSINAGFGRFVGDHFGSGFSIEVEGSRESRNEVGAVCPDKEKALNASQYIRGSNR